MLSKVTKIPSRTKKSSIWNFKRKNPELHLKSNKSKDNLTFSISGFNSVRIQIQQDFSIFEDEMNKTMESKLILNITNEILTNFNLDIRISNDQFLVRFYSIFRYLKFQMIIFFLLYFSVPAKVVEITIVFTQKSMVLKHNFLEMLQLGEITHQA